jgi:hypothetical protein
MRLEKICINCQLRNKLFFIVIHRLSLVKAAMNAQRLYKLCKDSLTGTGPSAMVFTKRLNVLTFYCQRRNKDHCAIVNWLPNWQLKYKEAP